MSGFADEDWLRALPKAETHCHLESPSPGHAAELAARRGVPVPVLRPGAPFPELFPYLDACGALVATAEEAAELAYRLARREAESGVRHFEVILNVSHWRRWWEGRLGALLGALDEGFDHAEHDGLAAGHLSVSILRATPPAQAEAVVADLVDTAARRVLALSVDGDEAAAGFTGRTLAPAFRAARAAGLRTVAHTGESGGAGHVRDTLEHLGPDRIDHGFRVLEDPVLARRVAAARIPLALCPSANIALGWCTSVETHPIEDLRRMGAHVSVHTDAPWQVVLWEEYARCRDAFDWSRSVVKELAGNAIAASFMPAPAKRDLLAEVAAHPT